MKLNFLLFALTLSCLFLTINSAEDFKYAHLETRGKMSMLAFDMGDGKKFINGFAPFTFSHDKEGITFTSPNGVSPLEVLAKFNGKDASFRLNFADPNFKPEYCTGEFIDNKIIEYLILQDASSFFKDCSKKLIESNPTLKKKVWSHKKYSHDITLNVFYLENNQEKLYTFGGDLESGSIITAPVNIFGKPKTLSEFTANTFKDSFSLKGVDCEKIDGNKKTVFIQKGKYSIRIEGFINILRVNFKRECLKANNQLHKSKVLGLEIKASEKATPIIKDYEVTALDGGIQLKEVAKDSIDLSKLDGNFFKLVSKKNSPGSRIYVIPYSSLPICTDIEFTPLVISYLSSKVVGSNKWGVHIPTDYFDVAAVEVCKLGLTPDLTPRRNRKRKHNKRRHHLRKN